MTRRLRDLIALAVALVLAASPILAEVTAGQKQAFFDLLASLPHDGEFFTDKGVKKAAPFIEVLFSLTESDIGNRDLYPFGALSTGLCGLEKYRKYGAKHFEEISHPTLKLFWGSVLFEKGLATREIVLYLRSALRSDSQAKMLKDMIGPDFEAFRGRVEGHDNDSMFK